MERHRTQAERLAAIETILENAFGEQGTVLKMAEDIKAIREDLDEDKANLAALTNKGKGALAAASLIFTGVGAAVTAFWKDIVSTFH